jgi:hypothetical protein
MSEDIIHYPEEIRKRVDDGMGCGSAIGEGWYDIIRELDAELAALYPDYVVHQVKEKFGGLRYYIGTVPKDVFDAMYEAIGAAEAKADVTCDVCGEPGKIGRVGQWLIATRCEKHKEDV